MPFIVREVPGGVQQASDYSLRIGAKATVLDCMVGDCEGICVSLQA